MRTQPVLVALVPLLAAPVLADAPLAPAPAMVCSLKASACAMRAPDGRSAAVWRKGSGGARLSTWRATIASPALQVSDDGRSLVEIYPGLNLLDPDAGPETVVLAFHRRGSAPVCVRLRDVIARPAALPATVSHRQWARAYGFDGAGSFLLLTAEGKSVRFDPVTGRMR
jgi:hypothetical protein